MSKQDREDAKIKTLIERIDKDPDRLHADVTPSVLELTELGLPGAHAVLELLDAPEFLTRKRAQRVLEGVVMRHYGWIAGQGYATSEAQDQVQTLLKTNGNYNADAPQRKRKSAIGKWRHWLQAQMKNSNS
jgi:hypothetical protein